MSDQPHSDEIVGDARVMFDNYLRATPDPLFGRQTPLPDGAHRYPEATVQVDTIVFSCVFTCLWRALEDDQNFEGYYDQKTEAFNQLARIVTPDADDHRGFTKHAAFWVHGAAGALLPCACVPMDRDGMKRLCKTLRNGFSHFNFRYMNVPPTEYFRRLGVPLPGVVKDPDLANNYRVFICSWIEKRGSQRLKFLDPESKSSLIATHFAHLRYHLFMFLARFFRESGDAPYQDILTRKPID